MFKRAREIRAIELAAGMGAAIRVCCRTKG